LQVEWDLAKNEANLVKHGIDFADAVVIFDGPVLEKVDKRRNYGEERIAAVRVANELELFVVYTMRGRNRRLISAQRANRVMREKGIVRRSPRDVRRGQTDWHRVATMSEEELIAAAKSDPDAQPTDLKFWEDTRLVMPDRKVLVTERDFLLDQKNVGRIAERIVSNELEARGEVLS
jgi:uncharacterized protein